MAATARPTEQVTFEQSERPAGDPASPMARLALLHAEASETAQLANLLGRSIYAAGGLAVLAGATIVLSGGIDIARSAAWFTMVAAAATVLWRVYARAMREPFQRPALKAFARDLSATLLYAGFAWGSGAFLVLKDDASAGAVVLFAAGIGGAVALLLREREAVFLFLAPIATLTSFASVLRPLPGGALDAALVLIACAAVAGGVIAAERLSMRGHGVPQLADLA